MSPVYKAIFDQSYVSQLPTVPTVTIAPEFMPVGESSKHAIERPGRSNTNLGETILHASGSIISLVKEAAALSPSVELKQAAALALIIFDTIQVYNLIDLWLRYFNCL